MLAALWKLVDNFLVDCLLSPTLTPLDGIFLLFQRCKNHQMVNRLTLHSHKGCLRWLVLYASFLLLSSLVAAVMALLTNGEILLLVLNLHVRRVLHGAIFAWNTEPPENVMLTLKYARRMPLVALFHVSFLLWRRVWMWLIKFDILNRLHSSLFLKLGYLLLSANTTLNVIIMICLLGWPHKCCVIYKRRFVSQTTFLFICGLHPFQCLCKGARVLLTTFIVVIGKLLLPLLLLNLCTLQLRGVSNLNAYRLC